MGIIRLFLAFVVLADHLQNWVLIPAGLHLTGPFKLGLSGPVAVMYFYVISGYLMSLVLKDKYQPTLDGTRQFYGSRIVRIFSMYWPLYIFVMIFDIWQARESITGPLDIFTGAFLFGADWSIAFKNYPELHFQAVPYALAIAWTLGAELTFYALAPLLLRSGVASAVVLILSFGLRVAIYFLMGYSDSFSYMFFPATICFFLLGHVARLLYERWAIPLLFGWVFLFLSIVCSLPNRIYVAWETPYFYSGIVLFALAIPGITMSTSKTSWFTKVGDFSYPFYLVHPLVLYFLFLRPGSDPQVTIAHIAKVAPSANFDVAQLVAVFIVGCVLATAIAVFYLVERPVATLMRKIAWFGHRVDATQLSTPQSTIPAALPMRIPAEPQSFSAHPCPLLPPQPPPDL